MLVKVLKPSITEAELGKGTDSNVVISIKPRRWSSKQQALTVVPVEVVNTKGVVLDSAVLTVSQKTGKLSLTKVSGTELECDADGIKSAADEAEDKKKKGKSL